MDNWKRKLANKDESAAKNQNVLILEVECKPSTNGVPGVLAHRGRVGSAAGGAPKGTCLAYTGTVIWWKRWRCPSGSDADKKFHSKRTLTMLCGTERMKEKMLEAGLVSSLRRGQDSLQGAEKKPIPNHDLGYMTRRLALLDFSWKVFSQKLYTNFQCF